MKCPHCGAEVNESDAFCGGCGKPLRREIEIAPKWKWGSMFASLVLTFIFWMLCLDESYNEVGLIILLIFGFPATIYLMYKERTKKIKYGLAWILFPIVTWFSGLPYGWYSSYSGRLYDETPEAFGVFIIFIIPAIVIDVIYVYYVYINR